MTATYIRYTGTNPALTLTLGALKYMNPHCGQDHERCVEIRFDSAMMFIPSAALEEFIRQSQETLAVQALKAKARPA